MLFAECTSAVLSTLVLTVIFVAALVQAVGRIKRSGLVVGENPLPKMKPSLKVEEYAEAVGCFLERYEVVTSDGFILELQRLRKNIRGDTIVDNCDDNSTNTPESRSNNKCGTSSPVLLIPGLLQTAGTYLIGKNSLSIHLLDSGFDVWLGNNRGGLHPQHVSFSKHDPRMWDWDVPHMALYDLPALLEGISAIRNDTVPVSLVSHSQGTAQCVHFVHNNSTHRIAKLVLLAPALYTGPLFHTLPLISFMRSLSKPIFNIFFGPTAFMPILMHLRSILGKLPGYGTLAYSVFATIFRWDDQLWDRRIRKHLFMSSPSYVSSKTIRWWLHSDNGSGVIDDSVWFPENSPPLLAVVAADDLLVDGARFIDKLQTEQHLIGRWKGITIPDYAHLDVLWAHDVVEKVGKPLVEFLNTA